MVDVKSWAAGVLALAAAAVVEAQITENPIPAPVVKRGLAVEVRDVVRLPETRSLRPVDPFCAYFIFMAPMSLFISTEPLRRRAHQEGLVPFAPPSPQTFAKQLKDTILRGMCTDYDKENL